MLFFPIADSQYQRRYSQKLGRKAVYGADTQLNRLRALNGAGNGINSATGKSLSEALIFASTNPQYDNKLNT